VLVLVVVVVVVVVVMAVFSVMSDHCYLSLAKKSEKDFRDGAVAPFE
jgi:hypothetical protein